MGDGAHDFTGERSLSLSCEARVARPVLSSSRSCFIQSSKRAQEVVVNSKYLATSSSVVEECSLSSLSCQLLLSLMPRVSSQLGRS